MMIKVVLFHLFTLSKIILYTRLADKKMFNMAGLVLIRYKCRGRRSMEDVQSVRQRAILRSSPEHLARKSSAVINVIITLGWMNSDSFKTRLYI